MKMSHETKAGCFRFMARFLYTETADKGGNAVQLFVITTLASRFCHWRCAARRGEGQTCSGSGMAAMSLLTVFSTK